MLNNRLNRVLAAMAMAALFLFVTAGCQSQAKQAAKGDAASDYAKHSEATAGAAKSLQPRSEDASIDAPMHYAARLPGAERNEIRRASLGVQVDDLEKAEKSAKEAVSLRAGYVVHEETSNLVDSSASITMQIRVPERSLDDLLALLQSLGKRSHMSITSSDVTEDILDREARLQQLRSREATLKKLGKAVPGSYEYQSIRDQINAVSVEQEALKTQSSMSFVDLVLEQKPNADLAASANASWGSDTWNAAVSSASGAFRFFGTIGIWLLVYSPLWGCFVLAGYLGYRIWKRTPSGSTSV